MKSIYTVYYPDHFSTITFEALKTQHPTLRKTIFDALQELTPEKLAWYLNGLVAGREWNDHMIDRDTLQIILQVLADISGIKRLRLTHDELRVCFNRFKQLQFLNDSIQQGLMEPVVDDVHGLRYRMLKIDTISDDTPIEIRVTAPQLGVRLYLHLDGTPNSN